MKHIVYSNPFKEKKLLQEADFRNKIIQTFKVNSDIADFLHNINDKLSIWIADTLFKQLVKERHFIRSQAVDFLNTKSEDRDNYLQTFQDKVRYVLDYYNNPVGKQEYPTFDKFKKEDFDVLHVKSEQWHNSLKGKSTKTVEIKDTEPNITIIKEYEPKENGEIYYWADLNKKSSNIESSRMGHCGTTSKGDTLLSLRSFYPNSDGTYTNKSHVTVSLNRKGKYYAQCKGKQNRKPAIQYTSYILDLFMFEDDIQKYEPEFVESYLGTNDFKVSDFSSSQINRLNEKKPNLVKQFISPKFLDFQNSLVNESAEEVYSKYVDNIDEDLLDSFQTKYSTDEMIVNQIIMQSLPVIIKDKSVFDKMIEKYIRFDIEHVSKDLQIELTIIDYCVYSNNFGKIKSLLDNYLKTNFDEKKQDNVVYSFCFYAKAYPDYFTPYATKAIDPVIEKLIRDEISLAQIRAYQGDESIEIIKKVLNKDKSKYKNIIYILHIEEIDKFIEDNEENLLLPASLNELIGKIEKANSELKEISIDNRFRKEIMNIDFFSSKDFESIPILYLYKKNPNLIDYSYYGDFNSDILNKKITIDVNLEDIPLVFASSYGDRIDIPSTLESTFDYVNIDVNFSDIEDYLDYIERDLKNDYHKRVYDRIISAIEKETGNTYSEILEEYSIRRLSEAIKDLNHDSRIDELYGNIERCFIYSYEASLNNETYEKIVDGIKEYADELGVSVEEKTLHLYENKGQLSSTVSHLIEYFEEYGDEEDYGNPVLDTSDFESLLTTYIEYMTGNINNIRIDFDRIYASYDNDVISEHILSEV